MTARTAPDWSPRQKQVLDLLARGHTNGQIAEALGISLDGAKWHVGEIITKLDVDTREEAAEYWRQRQGLRARLRVLTRTGSAPSLLRWLGLGSTAVLVVGAAAVAAFLLLNSGDDDHASPDASPNPAATATADPAATPTATAQTILGLPVETFSVTNPVSIPLEGMLYLGTGCWGCDGGGTRPYRAFVDPGTDEVLIEEITPPFPGWPYQLLVHEAGALYVLMCDPDCPGIGEPNVTNVSTIYRSDDGGVTWHVFDQLPGYVWVWYADGDRLLVDWTWGEGDASTWTTKRYSLPDRTFVANVDGGRPFARQSVRLPGGEEVQLSDDGRALVDSAGNEVWRPDVGPADSLAIGIWPGRRERLVTWTSPASQFVEHAAYFLDERPVHVFQSTGGQSPWITSWVGEGMAVGSAQLLGEDLGIADTSFPIPRPVPAIIDLNSGVIAPIEPSRLTDELGPHGRQIVGGFVAGPFARVANAGTCLNVREEPSTEAESLRCYVDGVLLRDRGGEQVVDGVTWVAVTTPDGRDGWAGAEFLER